jgi:hypothetical protein
MAGELAPAQSDVGNYRLVEIDAHTLSYKCVIYATFTVLLVWALQELPWKLS